VRYLTVEEVLVLHSRIVAQAGSANGVRSRDALESSVGQPHQTFGGEELYGSMVEKAAAVGFFLVRNHPFIDGNKRIGHAALEVTLVLNGYELVAGVDEQEQVILSLAAGTMTREDFTAWVERSAHPRKL
jgi:death-on-curing protein